MIRFDQPWPKLPTPAEEQLLACFWKAEQDCGRACSLGIRELMAALPADCQSWAYTTVATLLRRLEKKACVRRLPETKGGAFTGKTKALRYRVCIDYPRYREALFRHIQARYPEALTASPEGQADEGLPV